MKKIEMGKKYRTRDGESVRILCIDRKSSSVPVVGLVGEAEHIVFWSEHGSYFSNSNSPHDLVEVSPYADIPIDTPGWARVDDGRPWVKRHFSGIACNGLPMAWRDGMTSHTADGRASSWDEFTTTKPEGVE